MDFDKFILGILILSVVLICAVISHDVVINSQECSLELDGTIEGTFIILNITTDNGIGHFILNKANGKIKVTAPCKYLDELNL